ncbi:MAG TPA: DMT family transporter [Symbiobacteriaceae bacterium]|jgi:drug/metabolite transporter (DMT)-like permease|nr:DMT family transporter [Symbiobacteriaceae bacterium]
MNKTYLGYLLTMLSALAFASMSLFIKLGYGIGMNAWNFSLINSSFSLILMGVLLVREPKVKRSRVSPLTLILFVLTGAAAAIAFNVALAYLSISLATILLFTYPAFTALGAWAVLGQLPWRSHLIALAMTLAGAVLTANISDLRSGAVSLLGVALALGAAVSHGFYIVLGEKIAGGLSAIGATALTRVAILSGTILLYPRVFAELPGVPWQGWLICLASALVAGVAPFLFLNRGIALIGANRAAIASVAELPFALALGMLFQGDVVRLWQGLGALLIVVAVVVSQQQQSTPTEGA